MYFLAILVLHNDAQPIAAGTPDEVLRTLSAYRDIPRDELVLSFCHPGLEHAAVERSPRMFAKELLPEIRRWGG